MPQMMPKDSIRTLHILVLTGNLVRLHQPGSERRPHPPTPWLIAWIDSRWMWGCWSRPDSPINSVLAALYDGCLGLDI